jgi:hypothetical protein
MSADDEEHSESEFYYPKEDVALPKRHFVWQLHSCARGEVGEIKRGN